MIPRKELNLIAKRVKPKIGNFVKSCIWSSERSYERNLQKINYN